MNEYNSSRKKQNTKAVDTSDLVKIRMDWRPALSIDAQVDFFENIFVIIDDVIYTPGSWSSILLGITRDSVLQLIKDLGYKVEFQPIAREMLYMADEIFFTGTAAEVTPVRTVDRIVIGPGERGPITKQVQEEFFAITSGNKPDRHGWLTHVRKAVHSES